MSNLAIHQRILILLAIVIGISIVTVTSSRSDISAQANLQQLKVMTYNVLHNNEKDANFHRTKMAVLAQYLKEKQIDIVGLQEMKLGINDGQYLKEGLQAVGYAMPYMADGQDISGDFRNVLFSRYPISDFKEVPISASRSILDMNIDIPGMGKHHFIVLHIFGSGNGGEGTSCRDGFIPHIIPHLTPLVQSTKNIVLLGDFNMELQRWCDTSKLKGQFDVSCYDAANNPLCGRPRMIDYIAVHNDSTLRLQDEFVDDSITISDHRPVVATLVLKNPPTAPAIRGDFNKDGAVNLTDLQQLITVLHTNNTVFGLVGTDNFIDLFDYNELLALVKSSATPSPTPTSIPNPALPANMILIPAGPFQMGCSPNDTNCQSYEKPLHTVTLSAYAIDKYEVTNARYQKCVEAGTCTPPKNINSSTRFPYYGNAAYANYPVNSVTWMQSDQFCKWEGKRLPTEAEWEKAARGSADTRIYPWGDTKPDCTQANTDNDNKPGFCVGDTTEVGKYPSGASPYGVMDMSGNVYEWVSDWYAADYYDTSPTSNPTGPATGTDKGKRGGSWGHITSIDRVSTREWRKPTGITSNGGGFRCAISL